jgi:5-methylcytosine-specific restriction endonuclease McrA
MGTKQAEKDSKAVNLKCSCGRRELTSVRSTGISTALLKLFRESHEHCHYCGVWLELRFRTIDHVVPLSKGGRHNMDNIVVACKPCNCKKHDSMPDVILGSSTALPLGGNANPDIFVVTC